MGSVTLAAKLGPYDRQGQIAYELAEALGRGPAGGNILGEGLEGLDEGARTSNVYGAFKEDMYRGKTEFNDDYRFTSPTCMYTQNTIRVVSQPQTLDGLK